MSMNVENENVPTNEIRTRKQRTSISLDKILTMKRLTEQNQKSKFIAKTLELSEDAVNKTLQKTFTVMKTVFL